MYLEKNTIDYVVGMVLICDLPGCWLRLGMLFEDFKLIVSIPTLGVWVTINRF